MGLMPSRNQIVQGMVIFAISTVLWALVARFTGFSLAGLVGAI